MKRIMCKCPSCGERLMEVIGSCNGVVIICPDCKASVKIDVESNGRIKLNLEPTNQCNKIGA